MTKVTFFIKIRGDNDNYNVAGESKKTTLSSSCHSGSYPISKHAYHCSKRGAGSCWAHARNCFDENGHALIQNSDGTWISKSIPDIFPSASNKQIMDLGGYNYYLAVTYNNLTSDIIRKELNDELAISYNGGGNDVTPFEQAIIGSISPNDNIYPGTPDGFCSDPNNIEATVYNNYTCDTINSSGLITQNVDKSTKERIYCSTNYTDPQCTCYNVNRPDVDDFCGKNTDSPGCKEYVGNQVPLKQAGVTGAWQGGAACLAPNACRGDVFIPVPKPQQDCHISLEICNQIANTGNLDRSSATIKQICNQKISQAGGDTPGGGGDTPGGGGDTPGTETWLDKIKLKWTSLSLNYKIMFIVALVLLLLILLM